MIVIPCYNEEKRLNTLSILAFIQSSPNLSLLFVDDGSKDQTLEVLEQLHQFAPDRISVLSLAKNAGKAEAVRQGLQYCARCDVDYIGYWDADLATPLAAIEDFTRVLDKYKSTQVVYGARRSLLGHQINRTVGRRIVSSLCVFLARQAIRLPVGDTQCGAKLMRNTPELCKAISKPFSAGWLFDVELFSRLSKQFETPQKSFFESPLAEWNEIAGSKISPSDIIKSGTTMLRLIAQIRFGFPAPKLSYAMVQVTTVEKASPISVKLPPAASLH
jgi:glycosyltransferase involved in cell wall biosynthesis